MINITNFRKLLEHLKSIPEDRFDMSIVLANCGTVGCLAGHVRILNNTFGSVEEDWLGLDQDQSDLLFYNITEEATDNLRLSDIKLHHAIKMVETIIETHAIPYWSSIVPESDLIS